MSIDLSTMVLMMISFVVFMLLLNVFLFKPILTFMQQRQQKIDAGIQSGEKAKQMLSSKQEQLQAQKAAARKDSAERVSAAALETKDAVKAGMIKSSQLVESRRQSEAAKLYEEEKQLIKVVEQDIDGFLGLLQSRIAAQADKGTKKQPEDLTVDSGYTQAVLDAMDRSGICRKGGADRT